MSFVAIRAKIKEKLDAQKGTDKPLVDVFQENRIGFSGYPSVTFEPSDMSSDFESNTQNLRKYVFTIYIHQEIENVSNDAAIGILCGVIDTLVQDFEEDFTLGGVVSYCSPVPVNWGVYEEAAGKVKYAEIKLECYVSTDIN